MDRHILVLGTSQNKALVVRAADRASVILGGATVPGEASVSSTGAGPAYAPHVPWGTGQPRESQHVTGAAPVVYAAEGAVHRADREVFFSAEDVLGKCAESGVRT